MSEILSKEELATLIKEAIEATIQSHPLTPEEVQWVRLAIEAQAERAALRKAVIEKTFTGLIWAALVTGGGYLVSWFSSHWR